MMRESGLGVRVVDSAAGSCPVRSLGRVLPVGHAWTLAAVRPGEGDAGWRAIDSCYWCHRTRERPALASEIESARE